MLCQNIKAAREAKGLSQEELATKLNVVRQTISKWECGRSVPDADMLVLLSEELEVPVSSLLDQTSAEDMPHSDDLHALAEKLESINYQLARRAKQRRRIILGFFAAVFAVTALVLVCLVVIGKEYLTWDLADPEKAVAATALHGFEWIFIRVAPVILIASAVGFFHTWRKFH